MAQNSGVLIVGSILLLLASSSLATIPYERVCEDTICLDLYSHSDYPVSDRLTYSKSSGEILFVVRFSDRAQKLVIYVEGNNTRVCPAQPGNNFETKGRRSTFSGCLPTGKNTSRRYHANVVGESYRGILRKTSPRLSIDCGSKYPDSGCQEFLGVSLDEHLPMVR